MHETSIAQNILEIAIAEAKKHNASKINSIGVRVGKMSAIDEASLKFAFDALKADTIAANASMNYESVALMGKCLDCNYEAELEGYFVQCPKCSSSRVKILSGNELDISYIDID